MRCTQIGLGQAGDKDIDFFDFLFDVHTTGRRLFDVVYEVEHSCESGGAPRGTIGEIGDIGLAKALRH